MLKSHLNYYRICGWSAFMWARQGPDVSAQPLVCITVRLKALTPASMNETHQSSFELHKTACTSDDPNNVLSKIHLFMYSLWLRKINYQCILWGLVFINNRQSVHSSIKISFKINEREIPGRTNLLAMLMMISC